MSRREYCKKCNKAILDYYDVSHGRDRFLKYCECLKVGLTNVYGVSL